ARHRMIAVKLRVLPSRGATLIKLGAWSRSVRTLGTRARAAILGCASVRECTPTDQAARAALIPGAKLPGATCWPPPPLSAACLHGAGRARLVLLGEPDQLGVERAPPQLAFGARLVELAEANRHVAAPAARTPARLDDDPLRAARVARRPDEPESGQQLEFAVDRHVPHARRLDPLAERGG